MDPLTLALIGAGVGLLKSEISDKPRERRERKFAAATQRYSPWTGLQARPVKETDTLGNVVQGGMAGATFGMQNRALSSPNTQTTVNLDANAPKISDWSSYDSFSNARLGAANPYQQSRWNLLSGGY